MKMEIAGKKLNIDIRGESCAIFNWKTGRTVWYCEIEDFKDDKVHTAHENMVRCAKKKHEELDV